MKASTVTLADAKSSTYISEQRIFVASAFLATVASLIVSVAKKSNDLIGAWIIDRAWNAPGTDGRVIITKAVDLQPTFLTEGVPTGPNAILTGVKLEGTSQMRWGIGNVSAQDIQDAVTTALAAVDVDAEWAGIEVGNAAEMEAALAALLKPDFANVAARSGLESVLEMIRHFRGSVVEGSRIYVRVEQFAGEVVVKFFIGADDVEDYLETLMVTADKHIIDVTMKMPEEATVTAALPKYALE